MRGRQQRTGDCVSCGECCKRLRITSVLSHIVNQHGSIDEARAYYSFRGIRLTETSPQTDRVLLELDIPCDQLTPENRCRLHDDPQKKPYICHRYPWFQDEIETCGYSFE